jgi:membrane dipeptidase
MKAFPCTTWLLAATLAATLAAATASQSQTGPRVSDRAQRLHREAFVFDAHLHFRDRAFYLRQNVGQRFEDGQVDLPRLREGGVDALNGASISGTRAPWPAESRASPSKRLINR